MKKHTLAAAVVTLLSMIGQAAHAATIVSYSFEGDTGSPSATASGVSASSVTARDTTATFVAGRTSGTRAITTNAFSDADNNAFRFSITVTPGNRLDLTNFSVFTQASSTGPLNSTLFVNSVSRGAFTNPTTFRSTADSVPLTLTGLTGTVSFSLVGTGPAANSGSNFASTGTLRLDDLLVEGTVTAIPEPLAALGGLAMIGAIAQRRRRPVA